MLTQTNKGGRNANAIGEAADAHAEYYANCAVRDKSGEKQDYRRTDWKTCVRTHCQPIEFSSLLHVEAAKETAAHSADDAGYQAHGSLSSIQAIDSLEV